MHPDVSAVAVAKAEGVQLLCVGAEGVRPLQGRGMDGRTRCPGVARRADECDPFRVEVERGNQTTHGIAGSGTRVP